MISGLWTQAFRCYSWKPGTCMYHTTFWPSYFIFRTGRKCSNLDDKRYKSTSNKTKCTSETKLIHLLIRMQLIKQWIALFRKIYENVFAWNVNIHVITYIYTHQWSCTHLDKVVQFCYILFFRCFEFFEPQSCTRHIYQLSSIYMNRLNIKIYWSTAKLRLWYSFGLLILIDRILFSVEHLTPPPPLPPTPNAAYMPVLQVRGTLMLPLSRISTVINMQNVIFVKSWRSQIH